MDVFNIKFSIEILEFNMLFSMKNKNKMHVCELFIYLLPF